MIIAICVLHIDDSCASTDIWTIIATAATTANYYVLRRCHGLLVTAPAACAVGNICWPLLDCKCTRFSKKRCHHMSTVIMTMTVVTVMDVGMNPCVPQHC